MPTTQTRPHLGTRLAWVLLVGLLASACKAEVSIGGGGLDVGVLEAAIEEELFGEGTDQSIAHTAVDCPDDPDDSPGSVFVCTTSASGEAVTVRVTVGDDGADFIREQAIIDMAKARDFLAQYVTEQTGVAPASIDCPQRTVYAPGESFTCTANDGTGGSLELDVVVRDVEGNVDVNIV